MYKIIAFLCALMPVTALAGGAHHSNRHHNPPITINNYWSYTHNHVADTGGMVSGTAIAIATAQHQFDNSTFKTQVSAAVGQYRDREAVSFAVGKRFGEVLLNGSVSSEGHETGIGAAINWRW